MGCTENSIQSQLIECISLMGKRHVDTEWPTLVPELNSHLMGNDLNHIKVALECVKKICKKYRFMFRSDALYTEMNYVIFHFSSALL